MGDDDTNAIGVAAFDESDSSGRAGLRVSPHLFQSLLEIFKPSAVSVAHISRWCPSPPEWCSARLPRSMR